MEPANVLAPKNDTETDETPVDDSSSTNTTDSSESSNSTTETDTSTDTTTTDDSSDTTPEPEAEPIKTLNLNMIIQIDMATFIGYGGSYMFEKNISEALNILSSRVKVT